MEPGPGGVTFLSCGPSPLMNGTEAEEGKRKPPRSARGEAGLSECSRAREHEAPPAALPAPGPLGPAKCGAHREEPPRGAGPGGTPSPSFSGSSQATGAEPGPAWCWHQGRRG